MPEIRLTRCNGNDVSWECVDVCKDVGSILLDACITAVVNLEFLSSLVCVFRPD